MYRLYKIRQIAQNHYIYDYYLLVYSFPGPTCVWKMQQKGKERRIPHIHSCLSLDGQASFHLPLVCSHWHSFVWTGRSVWGQALVSGRLPLPQCARAPVPPHGKLPEAWWVSGCPAHLSYVLMHHDQLARHWHKEKRTWPFCLPSMLSIQYCPSIFFFEGGKASATLQSCIQIEDNDILSGELALHWLNVYRNLVHWKFNKS